ncbi:hypothetical protein D9M68_677960 [compost metagenome]
MHLAGLEDGNVELTVLAQHLDLEVRLHIFGSNAVLMDNGTSDSLANALLVAVFYWLASDVIKDLALFEFAFWRLGFLNKVTHVVSVLYGARLRHCAAPFRRSHHYWQRHRPLAPKRPRRPS